MKVDAGNVIVSAIKQAEDGTDLIVRCVEVEGRDTAARIELPATGKAWTCRFRPCEIKTFRVPKEAGKPVVEVDLLER